LKWLTFLDELSIDTLSVYNTNPLNYCGFLEYIPFQKPLNRNSFFNQGYFIALRSWVPTNVKVNVLIYWHLIILHFLIQYSLSAER